MKKLIDWWRWRKENKILMERLASAEDRVQQLQRRQQINHQTIAMYQKELMFSHAALQRKGRALKMLHKQRQAEKNHDQ
jgi:hypothetical protein